MQIRGWGALRGWWSGLWDTRRSQAFDLSLAVALAAVDAVVMFFAYQDYWLPRPVVMVCTVVIALALVMRRRHPVGLALFAVIFGTTTGAGVFAVMVILYSLGAYCATRRTVLTIGVLSYLAFLVQPGPTANDDPLIAQALSG